MKKQTSIINESTINTINEAETNETTSSFTAGAEENPSAPAGAGMNRDDSPAADNGNSAMEEAKAEILAALEANGVDTDAFALELKQFIDKEHRDVLWYGGVIAVVSYKGYVFSLEAKGEVAARLLHPWTFEVEAECYDKTESGGFYADMQKYILSDEDLHEKNQELLYLRSNNWLEIFVQTPHGNWDTSTWMPADDDIVAGVIEMVETMDDILAEIDERGVPERVIRQTATQFARCWGIKESKLEHTKAFSSDAHKRWVYMHDFACDELHDLMCMWAAKYHADKHTEPMNEFFEAKLVELFVKGGV